MTEDEHLAPLLKEIDEFSIGLKDRIKDLLANAYDLGYGQGLEDAQ